MTFGASGTCPLPTPQRADTRPAPLLVDNISDGTHFRAILAYDTGIGARTTRVQCSHGRSSSIAQGATESDGYVWRCALIQ